MVKEARRCAHHACARKRTLNHPCIIGRTDCKLQQQIHAAKAMNTTNLQYNSGGGAARVCPHTLLEQLARAANVALQLYACMLRVISG